MHHLFRALRRPNLTPWIPLVLLVSVGCGDAETQDPGRMGPGTIMGDPRTYSMGWAPSAPRPEEDLFLAVILVEERVEVAQHLRFKGMDIIFLVDPLDGLDRRREDPGLVAAGRSILEPEIRALGLGIGLERKAAYGVWKRIFERPLGNG